jgi:hypothetical protein
MITVIDVHTQRGWDAYDHLIDDSPGEPMIGRDYKSIGTAIASAERRGVQWPVAVRYTLEGTEYVSVMRADGANVRRVYEVAS